MDYTVFILSHSSPTVCKTLYTLKELKFNGKFFIVVDDKDTKLDEYKNNYSDLLIYNKDYWITYTDTGTFPKDECSAVYAKNFIEDYAEKNHIDYFIIIDDDLEKLRIRLPDYSSNKILSRDVKDVNTIFENYFEYMKDSNIDGLTFGMQTLYMGGAENYSVGKKRMITNIYFRTSRRKVNWKMLIYDDFNTSLDVLRDGYVFLMLPFISMQFSPQYFQLQNKQKDNFRDGGLVNIYEKFNSFRRAFFSTMISPSNTFPFLYKKVFMMKTSSDLTYPKIISDKYKK